MLYIFFQKIKNIYDPYVQYARLKTVFRVERFSRPRVQSAVPFKLRQRVTVVYFFPSFLLIFLPKSRKEYVAK